MAKPGILRSGNDPIACCQDQLGIADRLQGGEVNGVRTSREPAHQVLGDDIP